MLSSVTTYDIQLFKVANSGDVAFAAKLFLVIGTVYCLTFQFCHNILHFCHTLFITDILCLHTQYFLIPANYNRALSESIEIFSLFISYFSFFVL